MTLCRLLLLPMLAWSLSQAAESVGAPEETADQVNPAEPSHDSGQVTPELVKSWRKQAAQGEAQAQTNLGLLYSTGDGVPHDPREAINWFRKAAEQGDGLGQLMLAAKYFEGAGVARDPVKGMAWAILAAEPFCMVIDVGDTVFNISPAVTQNLNPVEVKQVQQLAAELRQNIGARRAAFDLSHLLGDHPGSRIVVALPSTGDEEEKTSPEAPSALNFGTIGFVPKPGPETSPPFAVGIVQANGNLVPIATFDGEDWCRIDLAEDWRRGKRGKSTGKWTLWYENPGPSPESPHRSMAWIDRLSPVRIEIATTGLIASEPRCNHGYGIFAMATDAGDRSKSLIECDYCCPEPKRGIATTSKSPPDRVARLDPENEEDRRIAEQIVDTFNELENRAFERTNPQTGRTLAEHVGPRLSAEKRISLPFVFDTVRVRGINSTYYYIEVSRGYYEHLRKEFPYAALLQGWFRATADELVWMTQNFDLTYMEQKDIEYDTLILSWRHGNVVDVLFKRSQWGSGYFGILRIDNDTVNEVMGVEFR